MFGPFNFATDTEDYQRTERISPEYAFHTFIAKSYMVFQ